MKILVLSKYSRKGASSRYRMFQYFPSLQASGVEITTAPLFDDEYLDLLYAKKNRLLNILKSYLKRIFLVFRAKDYDVLWVEKELFPWVPWFLEAWFFKKLKTSYVVDYDDAIFHQYDQHRFKVVRLLLGRKCDQVMQHAGGVVAGNKYLAERARLSGAKKVAEIPTVVSKNIFSPKNVNNKSLVIGWIGSMSTAIYLEKIRPALAELRKKYSFRFCVVGADVHWPEMPAESIAWSESKEVALVQEFDIGVMPLLDSPWERGKCGFKLIQYMACGKPVVADPVGVNSEIVEDGRTGYLVSTENTWYQALERLLVNEPLRSEFGKRGRERFEQNYSLERWQKPLYKTLQECQKSREEGFDV